MQLKALEGDSLSSGGLRLYAFADGDTAAGCVELYNYDPVNRRAAVGIVVAESLRRRGNGLAMLAALADFCTTNTSLHQLYADVAATNRASLGLFDKAGYTRCGTFGQWVAAGDGFIDTHRFQLILNRQNLFPKQTP